MKPCKFSKIENMWIFAMFDLPTNNKQEKAEHAKFRKFLLSIGFTRLQYSVYAKFCLDRENSVKYYKWIEKALPPKGNVRLLMTTDKQFSEMVNFYGKERKNVEKKPEQLLLF